MKGGKGVKMVVNRKSRTVFRSVFVPIIVIVCVQMVCFYLILIYGGVKKTLEDSSINMLDDNALIVRSEIESRIKSQWTDFPVTQDMLRKDYEAMVKRYGDKPFCRSEAARNEYLKGSYNTMEIMLSRTGVDGVFIILNDSADAQGAGKEGERCGIYLARSEESERNYSILHSPQELARSFAELTDPNWKSSFRIDGTTGSEYFNKPTMSAFENKGLDAQDHAFFSEVHTLVSGREVLTYSVPMLDENGFPYAIVGVDVTKDSIKELLHSPEDQKECVIVALRTQDNRFRLIASNGPLFDNVKVDGGEFEIIPCTHGHGSDAFELEGSDGDRMTGVVSKMKLYGEKSVFAENELCVLSISKNKDLYAHAIQIQKILLLVTIAALAFSIGCIFIISRSFSKPIRELAASVKEMEPSDKISLERLGVSEIDEFVDNIETLSRDSVRNMARTEFFARMSHDMRTPMNAIISFSSQKMLEDASEEQKDAYLAQINSAGQYLLGIINELLDMNKLESGSLKIVLSAQRASTLFDATVEMIRQLAKSVNVQFTSQIDIPDELYIMADKQHLNQVIMNLLANAVKFTQAKGTVRFEARITAGGGAAHGEFAVKDTGIGMSREFTEKMYEPFAQEGKGKPGTGLGLSIAKGIIDGMGGEIRCNSIEGVGTTFELEMDFDLAQQADAAESGAEAEFGILAGKKILLCEDHPINAQIAKTLLEKQGMSVDVADNGRIGVDMFEHSQVGEYAAVLMDVRMPVMNGLDATRAIRALPRADARSVPIVAMTANAFAEDVAEALDAGMDRHTAKPVDPQRLFEVLADVIAQKR